MSKKAFHISGKPAPESFGNDYQYFDEVVDEKTLAHRIKAAEGFKDSQLARLKRHLQEIESCRENITTIRKQLRVLRRIQKGKP